jgi:hypothetical protein
MDLKLVAFLVRTVRLRLDSIQSTGTGTPYVCWLESTVISCIFLFFYGDLNQHVTVTHVKAPITS